MHAGFRAVILGVTVSVSVFLPGRSALGQSPEGPADPAAFRGQGALAFVSEGSLWILDGQTGTLRRLPDGASPIATPAWSHDGKWLAWKDARGVLRIADRKGKVVVYARLPGPPAQSSTPIGSFSWSPAVDVLAVAAGPAGETWLAFPDGSTMRVAAAVRADSMLWSPGGILQLAGVPASGSPAGRRSLYVVVPPRDTAVAERAIPDSAGSRILLAGWTADDTYALYWIDPFGSASVAADGMALVSMALRTGRAHTVTHMLGYRDWLSPAPGPRFAAVIGGIRSAYFGKHVARCDARGQCSPIMAGSQIVTDSPAWSPAGSRILFVRAPARAKAFGFTSLAAYNAWVRRRSLWIWDAHGSREVRRAGGGVYSPHWSHDSHTVLYVRDNALWLLHVNVRSRAQKVAQLFPAGDVKSSYARYWDLGYYGYVAWNDIFAWYSSG